MKAKLRITAGSRRGQTIVLSAEALLVGRDEDCGFRADSELVSRRHCVFKHDEYTVRVRDLGSKNGTFVNGRQIQGEVVLSHGDRLVIGDMTLECLIPEAERPAAQGIASTDHPPEQMDQAQTGIYEGQTVAAPHRYPAVSPQHLPGQTSKVPPRVPTPIVPEQQPQAAEDPQVFGQQQSTVQPPKPTELPPAPGGEETPQ